MRNPGTGGMQAASPHAAIICPRCGKPAYKRVERGRETEYWHYTRKSSVMHIVTGIEWTGRLDYADD